MHHLLLLFPSLLGPIKLLSCSARLIIASPESAANSEDRKYLFRKCNLKRKKKKLVISQKFKTFCKKCKWKEKFSLLSMPLVPLALQPLVAVNHSPNASA